MMLLNERQSQTLSVHGTVSVRNISVRRSGVVESFIASIALCVTLYDDDHDGVYFLRSGKLFSRQFKN